MVNPQYILHITKSLSEIRDELLSASSNDFDFMDVFKLGNLVEVFGRKKFFRCPAWDCFWEGAFFMYGIRKGDAKVGIFNKKVYLRNRNFERAVICYLDAEYELPVWLKVCDPARPNLDSGLCLINRVPRINDSKNRADNSNSERNKIDPAHSEMAT